MLHGREAELRELLGATATAFAGGRGLTALVAGEAGIGKTRLVAEVADRLRDGGVRVAWAACRQDGGAPPYWPISQLLAALGRRDALTVPDAAEPEFARFLMFDAVAAAFRAAAPVLLVVDDLHWADVASVRLLDALRAHVAADPVVVLGTYRDTEPGAAAELTAERRIVVRGLSASELVPVLVDLTGETVAPATAVALHRRTAGNPFFAAEIVRMLRGGGRDDVDGTGVPTGVRAVLDRRLDQLPAATEAVLRAAAALDAGTTTGSDAVLLAGVAGLAPAGLAEAAAPAVEARLLVADRGRYRFPHALVAETLTARTPPAQRLDLHRNAAATLDARVRAGVGDVAGPAQQRLAAATLSGDPAEARVAAAAAAAAARAATDGTAYEDAVAWLSAALDVLTDADGPVRADLLCALGEAALAAGDPARARDAFTTAATLARALGLPDAAATAALGVTGGASGFEVDLTAPDRVALLDEALAALPPDDSALRCAVSARLSVALSYTRGEHRRADVAAGAVAMARRLDDPRVLAVALAAACDAMAGPGHVADRRAAATEIVECARTVRDRAAELLGRRLRLVALAEAGDWAGVDAEIDAYALVADSVRRPDLTWLVPLWRGARATMRGDTAAETRHAAELAHQAERSGSGNAELLVLTQDFVRGVLAHRATELRIDRFLELAPELAVASQCTVALLYATGGAAARAAQTLQAYLAAREGSAKDSEWLPEMVQAAQTAVLIGHRDAAAAVYAHLAPFAGRFAIEGILAATWGCVDAHLGRLAALLGDSAAASRHLLAAVSLDEAAGAALGERTRRWLAELDAEPGAEPGSGGAAPGRAVRVVPGGAVRVGAGPGAAGPNAPGAGAVGPGAAGFDAAAESTAAPAAAVPGTAVPGRGGPGGAAPGPAGAAATDSRRSGADSPTSRPTEAVTAGAVTTGAVATDPQAGRADPAAAGEATFRRDGEVWTLGYAGREVRLRDSKGLRDLAVLLARPGREVAVHELTGSAPLAPAAGVELADRTAIDAYRRRLVDLEDDLAEATAMNDPVRAERAAAERDALVDELTAVTGLGGRSRTAGSDSERMRKAVGNRIRQALHRIEAVHPALGRHLAVSVRTGTFCRYAPDRDVAWRL